MVGAVKFENDYWPMSTILLFDPQITGYNYCCCFFTYMYICIFFVFVFVLLYQFIYTLLYKGENHGLLSRLNDTRLCPFLLAKPFTFWSRITKILFSLKLLFVEFHCKMTYLSRKQHSDKSMK